MSKGQTLRDLVNERLSAAAEDIFVLFEKTILEYEEELCRWKQNQQLQSTRDLLHREGAQDQNSSTGLPQPSLDQEIKESQVKIEPMEPSVKQEDKELVVCVPEFSINRLKTEEDSELVEQRQTETREDIISSHFHLETEQNTVNCIDTDNDDEWEPRLSWFAAQMETDEDLARDDRTTSSQNKSAPEGSAENSGDMSGINKGPEKNQCSVCQHIFTTVLDLQQHLCVHTGEALFNCPICKKVYTRKSCLKVHMRTHTNEKPFSCSLCMKTFARKDCFRNHMRTHTGEKPFHCPTCNKAFALKSNLTGHIRIHTGERPFSCTLCDKSYGNKGCLKTHMRTHTGEKPHNCSICGKNFGTKGELDIHMRTHTGEKPYVCLVCSRAFSVKSSLKTHLKIHEEKAELN